MLAVILLAVASGTGVEPILDRLDRVAALYRDTALGFTCRERIHFDSDSHSTRTIELDYMYVNDKVNGLRDFRTEARRGGARLQPPREISPDQLSLPSVVLRAYSAIFMFERSRRGTYRYELAGREEALGREAVVIRFESIPPYRENYNDWFGLAWVDSDTSQLLKVDAMKSHEHEKQQRMGAELAGILPLPKGDRREYSIESTLTEFGVEEHGMRFPSRVVTRRSLHEIKEWGGARRVFAHLIHRVEQTYSKYNFYGVRTEEDIRAFVTGQSAPDGNR